MTRIGIVLALFLITAAAASREPATLALSRELARLVQTVLVSATDLEPGHSPIAVAHPSGGVTLKTSELLEWTLVEGDNTAADLLLRLCGGPGAVAFRLRELGLTGIRIDARRGSSRSTISESRRLPHPGPCPSSSGRPRGFPPRSGVGPRSAFSKMRAIPRLPRTWPICSQGSNSADSG